MLSCKATSGNIPIMHMQAVAAAICMCRWCLMAAHSLAHICLAAEGSRGCAVHGRPEDAPHLGKLIKACMQLEATERPSATELVQQLEILTQEGPHHPEAVMSAAVSDGHTSRQVTWPANELWGLSALS